MNNIVEVKDLVNNIDKYIVIDLRSPVEYESGSIKGAINLPLLDNEARKIIGTLYKENQPKAYQEGLKIGVERLPKIYEEVIKLQTQFPDKEIIFYCFRGGTRSSSVTNMMELFKIKSSKLKGGYKEYRKYILDNLASLLNKINWLVVTGNTGSGKTIVLNKLKEKNYPVIDLEGLANHRGSVFGSVGLSNEITQKNFEESLFYELRKYIETNKFNLFVESESRKIGNLSLPNELNDKLKISSHILLKVSIAKRVEIINEIYNPTTIKKDHIRRLLDNNEHFKTKMGTHWVLEMIELINNNDYQLFIERILLDYYDKIYKRSHLQYQYDLIIENDDMNNIVSILSKYYDKKEKH